MSITMTTVILFAVFGVLLFLGVPISISIVASSIVTAMSTLSWDQITFITMQKMNSGVESFSLLAVPLFILAGNIMNNGGIAKRLVNFAQLFVGKIPGSMGEVSALLLIVGGLYLIIRKVINWQTPVAYIATVAVLTFLFPRYGASGLEWMLYSIFGGGLMLGAFFMATDYATSPVTKKGQLIFGIGCGLFTVFIRYFGSYSEGVCYSIMIMNLCVALIDKFTKPARFGVVKSEKKEAAAK